VLARGSTARIGAISVLAVGVAVAAGWGIGAWAVGSIIAKGLPVTVANPVVTVTHRSSTSSTSASPFSSITSSAGPDIAAAPLLELNGNGDKRSSEFDVLLGWQFQWQTEGKRIAIRVTGDQDLGTVVDVPGPASGAASPPVAGIYQLEITADGPWSITVIQGTG
jgi:hypothetical protein